MKVHANAALGPAGRLALVQAIESGMTTRSNGTLGSGCSTAPRGLITSRAGSRSPKRLRCAMPSTTIEISRAQRQPLHRLVTQHISGIGDVYLMIEQGDFATAERFGLGFGEDIRMLNDLGWDPDDARDSYSLTQPRHELIEALKRLRLDAEDGLDAPEDERRKREEYDELVEYFTHGTGHWGTVDS